MRFGCAIAFFGTVSIYLHPNGYFAGAGPRQIGCVVPNSKGVLPQSNNLIALRIILRTSNLGTRLNTFSSSFYGDVHTGPTSYRVDSVTILCDISENVNTSERRVGCL